MNLAQAVTARKTFDVMEGLSQSLDDIRRVFLCATYRLNTMPIIKPLAHDVVLVVSGFNHTGTPFRQFTCSRLTHLNNQTSGSVL